MPRASRIARIHPFGGALKRSSGLSTKSLSSSLWRARWRVLFFIPQPDSTDELSAYSLIRQGLNQVKALFLAVKIRLQSENGRPLGRSRAEKIIASLVSTDAAARPSLIRYACILLNCIGGCFKPNALDTLRPFQDSKELLAKGHRPRFDAVCPRTRSVP